ncbi:hypothetical protein EDB81DRAFT_945269 [Dactylonectria macrodidyma]|uniref:F-box domain-containing protein n=1 Tax=Dactylonectria macrodidyma TaxID=307937 RepID=A0A9P9FA00_9HYPO|nr:hypothetical protein EDB81DRAFT_945269 [Dactylonectria macrodidyma]
MSAETDVVMEDCDTKQNPLLANKPSLTSMPTEVLVRICMHLDQDELVKAARVCSKISECAVRILFKREVNGKNGFRALSWATLHASDKVGAEIIRKYHHFKGNVNKVFGYCNSFCTALHLAAATDKLLTVMTLLKLGANPRYLARGLHFLMRTVWKCFYLVPHDKFTKAFPEGATCNGALNMEWLPLLIPIMMNYHRIVRVLLAYGAPGFLVIARKSYILEGPRRQSDHTGNIAFDDPMNGLVLPHDPPREMVALTAFHFAVPWGLEPEPLVQQMQMGFPDLIHHRSPGRGFTPMHVAAYTGDPIRVEHLAELGCSATNLDLWGLSPMYVAIERAMISRDSSLRRNFSGVISSLTSRGAHVSQDGSARPILVGASDAMRHSWKFNHRYIKETFDSLMKQGASTHGHDIHGETLAKSLARSVKALSESASFAKFAFGIIEEIGPDPVIAPVGQRLPESLIGIAMRTKNAHWFKSRYDIFAHHGQDLTGHIIRQGFHQCLSDENIPHFKALREHFDIPGGAEMLLWEYLDLTSNNLGKLASSLALEPGFNSNYRGPRGQGFLHLIISKLPSQGSIPEEDMLRLTKVAEKNARLFLKSGTSVWLRNNDNCRAFDLLLLFPGPEFLALRGIFDRVKARTIDSEDPPIWH